MKKILIVEDEIFVALDMQAMVEDLGFEVVGIAAERAEAQALADCDIALVDVNLRDGPTGPEIGRWLARTHDVRVIYTTANPSQVPNESEAGVGVIGKPASTSTLRRVLELVAREQIAYEEAIEGFTLLPSLAAGATSPERRA